MLRFPEALERIHALDERVLVPIVQVGVAGENVDPDVGALNVLLCDVLLRRWKLVPVGRRQGEPPLVSSELLRCEPRAQRVRECLEGVTGRWSTETTVRDRKSVV